MSFKLSHGNKPSRHVAFDIAMLLAKGHEISQAEKDSLVMYFAPNLPAKPKTLIQWVAAAAGVKDLRPQIHNVYVTNGMAYASDGYHMRCCTTDLADGFYEPKTLQPIACDLQFPNIAQFFDMTQGLSDITVSDETKVTMHEGQSIYTQRVNDAVDVDQKYLTPCMSAPGVKGWRGFCDARQLTAFDAGDKCGFVVMGVRTK